MIDAKMNVEKYYLAVGILEEIDLFLKLMRTLLPPQIAIDWPEHQVKRYSKYTCSYLLKHAILNCLDQHFILDSGKRTGSTIFANATEVMRKRLAFEYDFYTFITARFHEQLRESKMF